MSKPAGISVECDICLAAFWLTPHSILDCYTMEDWEDYPPDGEPDDYLFICPACEEKFVFD